MKPSKFLAIGIMTGNSLDAADLVLTEYTTDGSIKDLCGFSLTYPRQLSDDLRAVRSLIAAENFDMKKVAATPEFQKAHDDYIKIVADGVAGVIKEAEKIGIQKSDIDAIGFHGQTCGHNPPSVAKDPMDVYTIQIGNGQMLADLTGITTIYDFRSDDIINGGEGAPLAPIHNLHIAKDAKVRGFYPVAFCNGGNTGNMAIISEVAGKDRVLGFDVGPFNHFIDMLVREETSDTYDIDGKYGKDGKINVDLLRQMFNESAVKADGANFLLLNPPKSSDPQWYKAPDMMKDKLIPFADRLRTVEYFSAYIYVYSLKYVPTDMQFPQHFLVFGGGWKNPLVMQDFKDILNGKAPVVLDEHKEIFDSVVARIIGSKTISTAEWKKERSTEPERTLDVREDSSTVPTVQSGVEVVFSDEKGYGAQYMEARIFGDMAFSRVVGEPFSLPETSGCKMPTVGGIIRYPNNDISKATANFRDFLETYKSADLTMDKLESPYYNRAYPGFRRK